MYLPTLHVYTFVQLQDGRYIHVYTYTCICTCTVQFYLQSFPTHESNLELIQSTIGYCENDVHTYIYMNSEDPLREVYIRNTLNILYMQ